MRAVLGTDSAKAVARQAARAGLAVLPGGHVVEVCVMEIVRCCRRRRFTPPACPDPDRLSEAELGGRDEGGEGTE